MGLPAGYIAVATGTVAGLLDYFCRQRKDRTAKLDRIFEMVRKEAQKAVQKERAVSRLLCKAILRQRSLEDSVAVILAENLSSWCAPVGSLTCVFKKTFSDPSSCEGETSLRRHLRSDLVAVRKRMGTSSTYLQILMFSKGFHIIQAHRVAHVLWHKGHCWMALQIQDAVNKRYAIDIHPTALLGRRVVMGHGTGVTIGEAVKIGDDCTVLHGVTLIGTGGYELNKSPRIGRGVRVEANAVVVGNISIGDGAKISHGSVVESDIPAGATVAANELIQSSPKGNAYSAVGVCAEGIPLDAEGKIGTSIKSISCGEDYFAMYPIAVPPTKGSVTISWLHKALRNYAICHDIDRLFCELDTDNDGKITVDDLRQSLMAALLERNVSNDLAKDCRSELSTWPSMDPRHIVDQLLCLTKSP
mmetsp:Transcript_36213/g.85916  ORF Transcript_36213/g.85916 Transcript_36213/m.85916 type:complete len:416 (-) Transcript_36213:605-1852(-)